MTAVARVSPRSTLFRAPEPKLKLKLAADDSPLVPAQPHFKQLFAEKGSYGESFGVVEPKKAWAATKATASPDGKSGGDGKARRRSGDGTWRR